MEVNAEVWYKDTTDGWVPATIVRRDDTTGQIKFVVSVKKDKTREEFNVLANKDQEIPSLKLMNSTEDSELENLINLPFLHEPAILHCLELRYFRSQIYTYTGPILIAVNPFKKVDLYSDKLLDQYFKHGLLKSQGLLEEALSPHPFAIADAAYRFMKTATAADFGGKDTVADQSILISGESGAGKTESTKIVLRYLTTVASNSQEVHTQGSVMDKVLKSNPILEALGNAKTIRNDNSSRFGKFIELKFDNNGHLIGGFIRTYLLEKVRLTSQQLNERNFHIFYQMGVGGSFNEKERWNIRSARDFHYSNQGKCFGIERINDEADYSDLRVALKTLAFNDEDTDQMFNIIAGLMHLGQLKFDHLQLMGEEASTLASTPEVAASLDTAIKLLGISGPAFLQAVTERTITARNDKYQKKLTNTQASDARDSVSRIVYGKLFDWVVATINTCIQTGTSANVRSEIAVLDIFGFECLTENSFEQLCINYTNETLQQQFNQFIFKVEQAEYEAEGIEWSFVSFPDNQDCLDLIENKKKSIFRVLDDECMTAAGTDIKFAARMITELGEYARLSVSPAQKILNQFSINHYAGEVVYHTKTFIDKNKDELPGEAVDLMAASTVDLLKRVFTVNFLPDPMDSSEAASSSPPTIKGKALTSPTICTQFKAQLASLMSKIHSTKPHYIRCIKPNDLNKPDLLNRVRTTEQLRYGGVLEAVRVARSGFPVRFSHEEFYGRYRPIANPFNPLTKNLPRYLTGEKSEAEKKCKELLDLMWDDTFPTPAPSDKAYTKTMRRIVEAQYWKGRPHKVDRNSVQLGKGKVFFRKHAHDLFESRRSKQAIVAAWRVQAQIRRWLCRVRYFRSLKAIFRLQIAIKYFLFHTRFVKKRRLNAATTIQKSYRCHLHYKRFKALQSAVLSCQTLYRSKLASRAVRSLRIVDRALRLQTFIRCQLQRKKYVKYIWCVSKIQGRLKVRDAKRQLKELRIAAKDVGTLQTSNVELKLEIEKMKSFILRQQLDAAEARAYPPPPPTTTEDINSPHGTPQGTPKLVINKTIIHYIPQLVAQNYIPPEDPKEDLTPRERFDRNLQYFKDTMLEGIVAKVYTMMETPVESLLTFKFPSLLCFQCPSKRFSIMNMIKKFPDMPPVSIADIKEIHASLIPETTYLVNMTLSEKAERFFVSIIYEPCMFVAIEVKTPEARNFLVNGLRSLMSSLQLDCSRQLSTFNECKSQERFSEDDQVDYKKKYEQLVSQVLAVTNDVMEREDELILMRKREKIYLQRLDAREIQQQYDDLIRTKLSLRLGQLLIEREDYMDTIAALNADKDQLLYDNGESTPENTAAI